MASPTRAPSHRYQRNAGGAMLALLGLGMAAVLGRVLHINVVKRDPLLAKVSRQHEGRTVLPARRGMILDRRGRVVAASKRLPDVFVDPSRVDDLPALAAALSARINVSDRDIVDRISKRPESRYVVVAERVDEVTEEAVRELRHAAVGFTDRTVRTYPLGSSMGHVLGFVGDEGRGLEGVELGFDAHLRGTDGSLVTLRDARRRAMGAADGPETPAVDGGSVQLTLDAEVQRLTEVALETQVQHFEAESGVAIVLSPKTGDVLAMACYPPVAPEGAGTSPAALRRNRAITDPIEPGSTFKPIVVSGALDGGFVAPTTQFDCHNGSHSFGGRTLTDTVPNGLLDIKGIITKSSNIGMAQIALRMGNPALHETVRRFGFGDATGLGLPGEDGGTVHPLRKWNSYTTTSIPIGYELEVTPLQLVSAFAALVNDGILLRPRVVRAILDSRGEVLRVFEGPEPVRRVASSSVARFVSQECLVSVVENGSAKTAQVGPYKVMGKTGTAKLPFPDRRGYEPGQYTSLFVGAAPVSDPQVVTLVMIRRPKASAGYYGARVAAPAAGQILADTLAYWQVPPDTESLALRDRK